MYNHEYIFFLKFINILYKKSVVLMYNHEHSIKNR